MRRFLTIAILAIATATWGGTNQHANALVMPAPEGWALIQDPADEPSQADDAERNDGRREREEIRKSMDLPAGSSVHIRSINGSVEVQTADTNTAEILVIRSARKRADFAARKFTIELTGNVLTIEGDSDRGGRRPDVQARVVAKLPRSIDATVEGVNGRVTIGEIEGKVLVSGVNGSVNVAGARSTSSISGINGRVSLTLRELDASGLSIEGVNGKVELYFAESLNADLSVEGINGHVYSEIGNVTVQGRMDRSSFKGRIGSGGPTILVTGVNGNVELLRAGISRSGDGVSVEVNGDDGR